MLNNEPKLLNEVLRFIGGDLIQTQHVLLMYSLTKILVGCEAFDSQEQQITVAAAILSNIPVSSCKTFLICCGYVPSYQTDILDLISHKHRRQSELKAAHQILSEAAVLTDFVEGGWPIEVNEDLPSQLKTETGSFLFKTLAL